MKLQPLIGDYTGIAECYDELMLSGYYDYSKQLAALCRIIPQQSRVLELGIGTGLLAHRLVLAGYKVAGIDVTRRMLERARERLGQDVPLLHVDLGADDLQGEFDAAVSNGGVWYGVKDDSTPEEGFCGHIVDDTKLSRSIATMGRVIRPGGALLLSIQRYHASATTILPSGLVYEQHVDPVNADGSLINKTYRFSRDQRVIAKLQLTLRYYDRDQFTKHCLDAGFQVRKEEGDGSYLCFRKV